MKASSLWKTLTRTERRAWNAWAKDNPVLLDDGNVRRVNGRKVMTMVLRNRDAPHPAAPGREQGRVPGKQPLRRQWLGVFLGGVQHHLYHAFDFATGFDPAAKIKSQPAGDGGAHRGGIQTLAFDGAGLSDIRSERGQTRLGAKAKAEPLHPAEQAPLPMPDLCQQRQQPGIIPLQPGPLRVFVEERTRR